MGFQRILVAMDGSEAAARAVDLTAELATALGAQVAIVHVIDPKLAIVPDSGVPADRLLFELRHDGRQLLSTAAARLHTAPPPWEFLREGKPAHEILAAAREWDAQLIVIGTHGRTGLNRALWGSTAEGVVRHAACPVLVARAGSVGAAAG
jgi:nucleotide-binding universal stress UspA family protein